MTLAALHSDMVAAMKARDKGRKAVMGGAVLLHCPLDNGIIELADRS